VCSGKPGKPREIFVIGKVRKNFVFGKVGEFGEIGSKIREFFSKQYKNY